MAQAVFFRAVTSPLRSIEIVDADTRDVIAVATSYQLALRYCEYNRIEYTGKLLVEARYGLLDDLKSGNNLDDAVNELTALLNDVKSTSAAYAHYQRQGTQIVLGQVPGRAGTQASRSADGRVSGRSPQLV